MPSTPDPREKEGEARRLAGVLREATAGAERRAERASARLAQSAEEAGLVDGLSPLGVFLRIAIRLAAPGLITVALLSFIAGWTDLLFPISFTTTPEATPLTAGLLQMQTGYKIYWGSLMAGGVYLTLPTLILSFALQKYLIRGMRLGY